MAPGTGVCSPGGGVTVAGVAVVVGSPGSVVCSLGVFRDCLELPEVLPVPQGGSASTVNLNQVLVVLLALHNN